MKYSDFTKALFCYSILIIFCTVIFGLVYLDLKNPVQIKRYITNNSPSGNERENIQESLILIGLFFLFASFLCACFIGLKTGNKWYLELKTISFCFLPMLIPGFFLLRHFVGNKNLNVNMQDTFETFFLLIFTSLSFSLLCCITFKPQKKFNSKLWFYLLIISTLLFLGWYSYICFKRHWAFQSHVLDLGIFTQLAYNGSIGKFFEFTIKPEYTNFLGYHFSPILIILSVAYLIFPSIETVLAVQTLVLGLAAIPLYLLSYRILKSKIIAFGICFAYLAHPFVAQTVMFDFHEVSIEPFIIFTMFYFLSKRANFLYWSFFCLALLCKEDVCLFLIPVGLFLIFNEKEFKLGLFTILFSVIYAVVVFKLLMPAFSGVSGYSFNWLFAYLGNSPFEVLKSILFNPLFIIKKCMNWLNLRTIFFLFAPLMFAPLWSRWGLILLITPLFEVWLHESAIAAQGSYHHILVVVPFTFVAGIIGFKNFRLYYINKKTGKLTKPGLALKAFIE